MRDLTRAREDAVIAARKAKQRLKAFLLSERILKLDSKSLRSKIPCSLLQGLQTHRELLQAMSWLDYLDRINIKI
jgi:hypothetical protein